MSSHHRYSISDITAAIAGRHLDVTRDVAGIAADLLDGRHHPCPKCGGTDRFRMIDADKGAVYCEKCFKQNNGDSIAAVRWMLGVGFPEALRLIGEYLGLAPSTTSATKPDLIAAICRDKQMPIEAFLQFGPTIEKRGRNRNKVVRVPVWNERGEKHSYFDFAVGHKGWFARGKGMAGMFFPGRLPVAGETWHLVEGCKDASALVGLGLNAAGMPTSNLNDKYARLFAGVDVVLVPDLDTAGQLGAQVTGGRLVGVAASVRVARLSGEIVEKGGDDVRDVLRRTNGEQLVRDAIDAAEAWTPRDGEHDPKDGRPEVLITLAYGYIVDQVTEHLGRLGWASPWLPRAKRERLKLYQCGGLLVHVVTEDTAGELPGKVDVPAGTMRIRPLPAGQLPLRIADACQLLIEKETADGIERIAAPPPKWLIEGVYSRGEYGRDVRRLEGVITAPTLRADGTILQTAGYDDRTGLLYCPNDKFPTISDKPSQADAQAAIAELLDVVKDFPFVDDADRSAWLALALTQVGRSAIDGCAPFWGISSTCPGAGKGLLCDCTSLIAYGRPAARKPYSAVDDEQRKAITATAIEALPAVLFDNVDRTLGGSALDAAITATTWSDRILGSSKTTGEIPLRTVWTATGNNLRFGSDLARRVLPIRLAPTVENPEDRDFFEHKDLLGWVRENRPRLAVAALTILRAYFVVDKPEQPGGTWGSFENWSTLVRGAIVWAGLADPLVTRETAKADDQSGAIVCGLVGGLLEVDETGEGMTARQIADVLNDQNNIDRFPTLRDVVAEVATVRGVVDSRKLGNALRKYRGRIANGFRIDGEPNRNKLIAWKTTQISAGFAGYAGSDSLPSRSDSCVSHTRHTRDTQERNGSTGVSDLQNPAYPAVAECDHLNQKTWVHRDGKAFCPGCNRFMGRVRAS